MGACHSNTRLKKRAHVSNANQITVLAIGKENLAYSPQSFAEISTKRRRFKSRTNTPGSLRSSRRYYKDAMARKDSELERQDSRASLLPRLLFTPLRSRRSARRKERSKAKTGSRKAKERGGVKLSKKLKGLTKDQLTDLILRVTVANPNLEKEFHEICPRPDLVSLKRKLLQLLDGIYKAFPKYHIGSMRDNYCYEKVISHIQVFKNECSAQLEQFYKESLWSTLVDFVLIAWPIINRLPEWNIDDQNIVKRSVLNHFVTRLRAAIRVNKFTKEEAWALKMRIEEALKLDRSIEAALDEINKTIACNQDE